LQRPQFIIKKPSTRALKMISKIKISILLSIIINIKMIGGLSATQLVDENIQEQNKDKKSLKITLNNEKKIIYRKKREQKYRVKKSKLRFRGRKPKFRRLKTTKEQSTRNHSLFFGLGADNFSINKIDKTKIKSDATSKGFVIGISTPVTESVHLQTYIGSYTGANYSMDGIDAPMWTDSKIKTMGFDIDKRFISINNHYFSLMAGIKYRQMITTMGRNWSDNEYKMTSFSLPIGLGMGFQINKSMIFFIQASKDVAYISKRIEIGKARADKTPTELTNFNFGVSYELF